MKTTQKRTNKMTINLTDEELELLQRVSEENERKPSEQARVLLMRACRLEWGNISNLSPLATFTGERNTTDTLGR